ncbi:MAG: TolC family protein [Desulfuromonadales bacterium]|nr:TolC family protein [Desulfuromonadales bacterium]
MKNKFVGSVLLCLAAMFAPACLLAAEPVALVRLLEEADLKNPGLLAAHAQISVAASKIDQVTSLQDPVLSLALSNYPIDELKSDVTPMTGNELRLTQKFPFPGKLDAKGRIAAQKSRWFVSAYQDARLQVRRQVKDAWYRLQFQQQAIDLTNRNLELLDDFITMTETRYEVGKGLQQNVLKAHLQRSRQMDKLIELQQQQQATLAELNSLAGRETDQPLAIDDRAETADKDYSLEELQRQAEQNRPMFAAFAALIDQYKAERKLAELDSRPDITVWGGYRWRDDGLVDGGTDFVSAGVSLNLPVYRSRIAAGIAEADSSLRLAYQKRNDFNSNVKLAIHQALSSFRQASTLAALYRDGILPQAEQTFQATLSAYQVDKADFLSLLDALTSVYRSEIDYARALSDQLRSKARIEAAAGLEIDQLPPTPIEGQELS